MSEDIVTITNEFGEYQGRIETRYGVQWEVPTSTERYYHSIRKPHPLDDPLDYLVLIATHPKVFHWPMLQVIDDGYLTYLREQKPYTWGAYKIPLILSLGITERFIPACRHLFWSPYWQSITVRNLIQVSDLFDEPRPCKLCPFPRKVRDALEDQSLRPARKLDLEDE